MLELPSNLVRERTARDWIAALIPVLCKNLLLWSMSVNATGTDDPTWGLLLSG